MLAEKQACLLPRCLRKNLAYAKILVMAHRTRTYLLVEERLGKSLARTVSAARRNGKSWNAIAREIHEQTQVAVTSETLRLWFFDLPKDSTTAEAGVA